MRSDSFILSIGNISGMSLVKKNSFDSFEKIETTDSLKGMQNICLYFWEQYSFNLKKKLGKNQRTQ